MKKNIEIAVIFKKKEKGSIINYYPHHITVGHKDEHTGEFITRSGKKYPYMMGTNEKYGYGLRQTITFKKTNPDAVIEHPIRYVKEYALSYFESIRKNCYQFIIPSAGDYEEVRLAILDQRSKQYYYVEEKDLKIAKNKLKQQELFEAKAMISELKSRIVGQDRAIEEIVSILWQNTRGNIKNNILLIGPTGVGKTEIIRTISNQLNVPTITVDATSLIATGYVGQSIEDVLVKLINAAGNNLSSASRGIIFLDEIDKKAGSGLDRNSELGTSAIQDELLKLLEDGEYVVNLGSNIVPNYQTISTKNITIVASGAFTELLEKRNKPEKRIGFGDVQMKKQAPITTEELYQFGLKKELLGRLPNIIELNPLTKEDLVAILKNKNNKTLEEKINLLRDLGISVCIEDDTLQQIAQEAIKKNAGARGLIGSVEMAFKEPMKEICLEPSFYQELVLEPVTKENPKGYRLIKRNNSV